VLCFIVIGCFFGIVHGWGFFVASTIIGALFHSAALFICYACQQTQIQKTYLELMLNIWFAIALFSCSILLMTTGLGLGAWIAAGVFCLLLAVVYGGDAFFAYRNFVAIPVPFTNYNANPAPFNNHNANYGGEVFSTSTNGQQPSLQIQDQGNSNPYAMYNPYNPTGQNHQLNAGGLMGHSPSRAAT
ncbi:unnamed protein product, partial [Meganyctiphanes norvegica]